MSVTRPDEQYPVSIELLNALLSLDPVTGKLTWRRRNRDLFANPSRAECWNSKYASKEAFTADKGNGYRTGRIGKRNYLAHRVVWALQHGKWPDYQIDHINGQRSDNRPANLRDVPESENHRNVGQRVNHASGVTGVYWHKQISKWIANIVVDGKTKYLGAYVDKAEAAEAYEDAKLKHGYHANHGAIRNAA